MPRIRCGTSPLRPGRITLLVRPSGPGVRVDSGVFQGSVVPLDYDPMVAKLVVHAPDRPAAVARLRRALQEYQVRGIATTLTLFRALVEMDEFVEADFHTGFLDELLASQRLAEVHGTAGSRSRRGGGGGGGLSRDARGRHRVRMTRSATVTGSHWWPKASASSTGGIRDEMGRTPG